MRYTKKQKEVMVEAAVEYYKMLKESGVFEEYPPSAHQVVWAAGSALRGLEPINANDVMAATYLGDTRWEDL